VNRHQADSAFCYGWRFANSHTDIAQGSQVFEEGAHLNGTACIGISLQLIEISPQAAVARGEDGAVVKPIYNQLKELGYRQAVDKRQKVLYELPPAADPSLFLFIKV
jgi:hypothetical protein